MQNKERKHYKAVRQKTRTINVDDQLWLKAQEAAAIKGCSISELMRQILLKECNRIQKTVKDFKQAKVVNE